MPLPASGPLSMSDINTEFGRGLNLNAYRGTTWYTSAGGSGTFSAGAISISEFYSKQAAAPINFVNPLGFNGGLYGDYSSDGEAYASLSINTNGTWNIYASWLGDEYTGNWATPTTAGAGTGKYVRFTLNSTSGSISGGSWSSSTGWQELTTNRDIAVSMSNYSGTIKTRNANYTVQIATDSGGTNIVSTSTITLQARAFGSIL